MDELSPSDSGEARRGGSVEVIEGVVDELYDLMRRDLSFEDKAKQALEIGRIRLGADNGHLTRIDQETDHWEALVSTDPPEGKFPAGLEVDLTTTYCRRVLDSSSQIALSDAPKQGWADDPAYAAHGLHCYVGTPLRVNGEQFGTVCFVSEDPRETPFADSEKMLAELIAHMLERELEREQFESQLTRQTNLSLVLNRVLRHNLRNEMAIIRGYTQMIADALADSTFVQKALDSIDRLINLSEKARELDEIVASDEERDQANISAIVEEVVASIRRERSSASISIDADEEVTAAVLPSFRRALWELIENAVKHGGTQPTVEIVIDSVPNAVEISIIDDGPGLDNQEIEVLRSGSETPLMHGSGLGLWLTHWIVSRHDGSIEASVTDEGTTLTVTVPRTPLAKGSEQVSGLVRARDQYKAAFDEAGDGMTITDDEARILDVNDEAASIIGMNRQELLGRSMQEFLPDDFDFESEWSEIKTSDGRRGELKIANGDVGVSTVEYTAKTDVVPGQHLIVSRDVTERNERERELKRMRDFFEEAERLGGLGAWEVDGEENLRWTAGTRRIHEVDEDFEPTLADAIDFYHREDRQRVEEAVNDARTAGNTFDIEARIITAAGNLRWIRASGGPTDSGETIRGYTQDITEQKEREREVVEMKERYHTLLKSAPDPVIVADGESGEIIEVSDAAKALFERPGDEFSGLYQSDLHPADQAESYRELFEEHIQSGGTKRQFPDGSPIYIVTADGEHIPVEISGGTVELSDGPVTYAIIRDMSDHVERERKIEQERAKFRGVFEDSFDAMVIADDDGRYIDVNESATDLFGVPEEELLGQSIADFAPEDFDFAEAWQEFQESEKERGTFPLIRADGNERIVEFAATRDIVPGKHLSILRDVTEDRLQKRKQEQIIERVTDAIVEVDSDWRFTLVNEQAENLFDMHKESLLGRNLWDVFEDARGTTFEEEYRGVMETRESTSLVEYFTQLDGWFDIKVYPKDDGGLEFYFVEVTERYERERDLERSTEFLSTLFETIPAGVTVLDADGTITQANAYAEAYLGIAESEITDRTYQDPEWKIFGADGGPIPAEELPFSQVMETGEAVVNYEHGIELQDGSQRWLSINAAPITGENGHVEKVIAVITDNTDLRGYRQALEAKNERLEEFASTISHDLRNPLSVAQGRLELAQADCDSDHLEYVDRAQRRMEALITDMLTLAREGKAVTDTQPVDLAALVESCWTNVDTENATIVVDIGHTVQSDESRLLQLFENLFRNSVQHGGENVTVTVGELDRGFYVEDDGPGIPADNRDEVFDAGFSTTEDGTGFGLSIVKEIVEAHGWEIRITESSNGGARFEITGIEFAAE